MKNHILNAAKALTATVLISGGIALAAPAYAISTQADQVITKIDLRDLETDYGVAKVYAALERRAKNACSTPGAKSIGTRIVDRNCTKNLLIDFVEDVDDARLTVYHEKMQS